MDSTNAQYDPIDLVHDVRRALRDKGLPANQEAGDFNAAVEGASQILRWLGLDPVFSEQHAAYRRLDLDGHLAYNRRIHGD